MHSRRKEAILSTNCSDYSMNKSRHFEMIKARSLLVGFSILSKEAISYTDL